MSLYESKTNLGGDLPSIQRRRFPLILVILVLYISGATIFNSGSVLIWVSSAEKFRLADVFAAITGLFLSVSLLLFCFGLIRKIWPPVIVGAFSVVHLIKFMTANGGIYEGKSFISHNELFFWFASVTGVPDDLIYLIGFDAENLSVEGLRMYYMAGVLVTFLVCCFLIYLSIIQRRQREVSV